MLKMTREALKHEDPTSTSAAASKGKTGRPPLAELPRKRKAELLTVAKLLLCRSLAPAENNYQYHRPFNH
jgi:hypothetical protein